MEENEKFEQKMQKKAQFPEVFMQNKPILWNLLEFIRVNSWLI
ncbi:MAG: hypothetical protein WBC05_08775 [Sedimentisphaerales bacterium]